MENIIAYLRTQATARPAFVIAQETGLDKATVNAVLYGNTDTFKRCNDRGGRPQWELKRADVRVPLAGAVVLLVDMGNVHDVLEPALDYLRRSWVHRVLAVHHTLYNGFGVGLEEANVTVASASNVDVAMAWSARDVLREFDTTPVTVYLATKGKSLPALGPLIERANVLHKVVVVADFAELRNHIE
jgi:hypothetical protein